MIQNKCKLVGITGGIASGKTSVKNILTNKGYIVIDSDIIAREVVEKGKPPYYGVIDYFGNDILDKKDRIDRKKLGQLVFNSLEKRMKLEEILYPYIFEEILAQIHNQCLDGEKVVFIDIPLLFENKKIIMDSGITFDQIWLVYCDRETQLERLTIRDNISLESANLRINAQMDIEDKKKMADVIIENTSTKEALIELIDVYLYTLEKEQLWNEK